jgi:photosystem II stability/assembly factor-like uncharacterized protein
MIWRGLRKLSMPVLFLGLLPSAMHAVTWFPLGPYGGDARSFAADPSNSKHLYLGTATGWLYESNDDGSTWARLSRIDKRDDLVLRHILIDPRNPKRLLVGAYAIGSPDGGLYISDDGGRNWYAQAEMRGQSIRSMAQSLSDPDEFVAGTLKGVYRSTDNGKHWKLISPEGSTEIHEVESLAIDPADPKVIYAGTWHLPWKTVDGGEKWENIKQGLIDDSDVFSIIIDPAKPSVVYASACSGIYKSVDAAAQFKKIQGIPSTARRTRRLLQDPVHPETVYAGTTEGLYRTQDGGKTFTRMTGPDVIVNDVYVDPKNPDHVLLATDRGGVLRSEDGSFSFQASNAGFSAQQVTAFATDSQNRATVYVGVANAKETGGVFRSVDGGLKWEQQSTGLGGRDVFSLASTPVGTLLAGTEHGVFRLGESGWSDSGSVPPVAAPAKAPVKPKAKSKAGARPKATPVSFVIQSGAGTARKKAGTGAKKRPAAPAPVFSNLDAAVYSLVADGGTVYAATSEGLLRGDNDGHFWTPVSSLPMSDPHFVAAEKTTVVVAGLKRIDLSLDAGTTWNSVNLPQDLKQVAAIAVDEQDNLWVGGHAGVFRSTDHGQSWVSLPNLFVTDVDGIFFDEASHRVLIASASSTITFAVSVPDYKVKYWETGWNLRFVRAVGNHLIGATMYDGMVVQPEMVVSEVSAAK